MAIVSTLHYAPFDEGDPDDFRPNSKWALVYDPGEGAQDFVDNITVIFEEIAPGDRIPLHTHPIHEVMVIDDVSLVPRPQNHENHMGADEFADFFG